VSGFRPRFFAPPGAVAEPGAAAEPAALAEPGAVITLDDELVRTTLDAIARARELASRGSLPDPLDGDEAKKCEGCSLVGICLPDEVRLLRDVEASAAQPAAELLLIPHGFAANGVENG